MTVRLRAAVRDDAEAIAALINIGGEGLPRTLWARWANYGQDPMDVGQRRVKRDAGILTWKHAVVAEKSGEVAGVVLSHAVGQSPAEMTSDTHPMLRPLSRLENHALNTRHVNVLAVFPEVRRKGIGTQLMAHAEQKPGAEGMSLILTDTNKAGRAFCRALGYIEVKEMPIVQGDWKTQNKAWILLTKH